METWKVAKLEPQVGDREGEYRSEPIPEENDGPMTKFVADNLLNYLYDDSKDLFIKYYHRDCKHCVEMEEDW